MLTHVLKIFFHNMYTYMKTTKHKYNIVELVKYCLPLQTIPFGSKLYPAKQVQVLPTEVLVQFCAQPPLLRAQVLISVREEIFKNKKVHKTIWLTKLNVKCKSSECAISNCYIDYVCCHR